MNKVCNAYLCFRWCLTTSTSDPLSPTTRSVGTADTVIGGARGSFWVDLVFKLQSMFVVLDAREETETPTDVQVRLKSVNYHDMSAICFTVFRQKVSSLSLLQYESFSTFMNGSDVRFCSEFESFGHCLLLFPGPSFRPEHASPVSGAHVAVAMNSVSKL